MFTPHFSDDGAAAGAAGNDWTMMFDRASTHSAAELADIDVRVDARGQRVAVRFNAYVDTVSHTELLNDVLAGTVKARDQRPGRDSWPEPARRPGRSALTARGAPARPPRGSPASGHVSRRVLRPVGTVASREVTLYGSADPGGLSQPGAVER